MPPIPLQNALDRAIVDILSLLFESSPRSTIARAISSARLIGHSPKLPEVHARLDALTNAGLLVSLGESWSVAPAHVHEVTLAIARRGDLDRLADAVRVARPSKTSYHQPVGSWEDGMREARFALYAGRWPEARNALSSLQGPWPALAAGVPPAWLDTLPSDLVAEALVSIVHDATRTLTPCPAWLARLDALPPADLSDDHHHFLVGRRILEGRLDEARRLAIGRASVQARADLAWLQLLAGDPAGAVEAWEQALTAYLKEFGKRARYFPDRAGLFFVIALLALGRPERARTLAEAGRGKGVSGVPNGHAVLSWVCESVGSPDIETWGCPSPEPEWDPVEVLVHALAQKWLGLPVPALAGQIGKAEAAGLGWLSQQLARCVPGGEAPTGVDLSTLVRRPDRSSQALAALEALVAGSPRAAVEAPPERDVRLVWVIPENERWVLLEPREQVRTKGRWSKGRPVALKRLLHESAGMEHLTAADRAACAAITEEVSTGRYRDVSYHLDSDEALRALAGQPNLLAELGEETVPAEVRRTRPVLRAEPSGAHLRISLTPTPGPQQHVQIRRTGPATFEVVEFAAIHHAIAGILGKGPLDVSSDDTPRVRTLLAALSTRLPVEADLGGEARTEEANPRPVFELRRRGEGLAIEAIVSPLGPTPGDRSGPRVRPGEGATDTSVDGREGRVRAVRDLAEERRQLQAVLDVCPTLAALGTHQWVLPARESALTALSELQAASAATTWPDGAPWVFDELGVADLELRLSAGAEGFVVDGKLRGVELGQLLVYLSASPGRFLGDSSHLIALTAELRRRLDELRALSEGGGARLRFHALRLPLVDELLEGAHVRADAAWRATVSRLTTTGEDPAAPSTLRGELRPYQADGFRWLARLGRWGVGGCLADDMGLGKTLQLIALLLLRAPEGPSLVVAPTSVLWTWTGELQRWAPTLRVRTFSGPRRDGALVDLGPLDVVLTSYAVLPLEIDALARVQFVVAVLDEAQAIKNPDTARARAAFALTADQRVATTGTPVENRLSDLWSLYRFLDPGLLGTASDFERRFTRPIEKERDRSARDRLRRLVAPFLLRRTKSEVLPELPARTEVTVPIELNAEEIALYEAIRAETFERLVNDRGPDRRFLLLAGITKLRRAASHARMVVPDAAARSSKLEVLTELLDDVVPRGHKALVFSQFVDHLQLAREAVTGMGLRCQYLDGSTPTAARKRAIDAFQSGDGDVFLISLKAGGLGLNLTAADYVIHLDPWWNPAAEDQASDRSHRLGQTRPVTVYRLVARDTVEDHIVDLHHRKRELAAGLLRGADAVGALDEAELLDLLRPTARR